jgi:hypothetical protein
MSRVPPPSRQPKPVHAPRLLALAVLALIAYANSFQAGLIFDNAPAILQDTRVRALTGGNLHLILTEEYWYNTSTTGLYRPLTTFSYLLNYAVLGNGPNPAGYHWVNLLLHGANISLVYLLAVWIAGDANLAFALAVLWGVHPLLTDSVTNIVGRADLLATLGVLGGLLAHIAGASATGGRRLVRWTVLAAAASIAIFSKEVGAVLPGVMLLYDLTWWKPGAWRARAPGYAALALPFAAYFWLRGELLARVPIGLVPFGDNPLTGADFWTAKLTALQVIGKYIALFVWPARLSADYSYAAVPLFGGQPAEVAALAICVAAAILAILSYCANKGVFFYLVFFFLTLAPTSNVFLLIGSIMAERFLYLPSIGLAGCAVLAIHAFGRRLSPRWPAAPRAAWAVLGLAGLAFAARTYARNPDWRDDRSLWSSVVSTTPGSSKGHSVLAGTLIAATRPRSQRSRRGAGDHRQPPRRPQLAASLRNCRHVLSPQRRKHSQRLRNGVVPEGAGSARARRAHRRRGARGNSPAQSGSRQARIGRRLDARVSGTGTRLPSARRSAESHGASFLRTRPQRRSGVHRRDGTCGPRPRQLGTGRGGAG